MSEHSTGKILTHKDLPSRGIEKFNVTFGDIPKNIKENLNDSILSCSVEYSMALATEISLQIIDRNYTMIKGTPDGDESFAGRNYFNIGRDVTYMTKTISDIQLDSATNIASVGLKTILMEVAEISVTQEQSVSPIWTIKCRPKAVQQMKRDKKPEIIQGNGSAYVIAACKKYGLIPIVEPTSKNKKITKASGDNEADSVWTVIQNLAQEAKFKCFEVDGTLFFGSMKWLMHKWGPDEINYTAKIKNKVTGKNEDKVVTRRYIPLIPGELGKDYEMMKLPTMNKSDNAVMEATGSAEIERTNGVGIRPGMTVFVSGIPTFVGYYLVTSVNFEERSPNAVSINFETPERSPKEKIVSLPVGPIYPETDDPVGPDVLIPYLRSRTTAPVNTGTSRRPNT